MFRKLALALVLTLPALALQSAAAAEPLPPAAQWVPQEALLVVELFRPDALLDLALGPKVAKAVTAVPLYQQQAARPEFQQFLAVVNLLETQVGTDWRTALRTLVGGGVTFAVGPDDTVLLIVDAKDAKLLGQLHETFLGIARGEAQKRGRPEEVASREYRGVTGWTFNKGEVHAIVGNRLLVSNRPEVLKAVLDLRADPEGKSLASLPAYQAAKRSAGPEATATAFVNVGVLKGHPPIQQALTQAENPLAVLLFAGVTQTLRESNWLALGLHVEGEALRLKATVDGKAGASGPAAFASPRQPGGGAPPELSVPRRIAGLSFYRDLHGFYAAKDDLFPERTSGLIFFENMMGIFFGGMDLTEEVLGETKPEVRFVVARQEYDPAVGTPRLQLPAFAAIFRLRNPEAFAEIAEEAWQKAVGLINFTRGQQAQPGLIIDRPTHAGTKFTVAYFRAAKDAAGTNVDSRFNFRPALAQVGEFLILSSTEGLAADLIDALNNEAARRPKPSAGTHSLVKIDGAQLTSILKANRENLIRQNMIEKGNTRTQAENGIDLLLTILGHLGEASLDVGSDEGRAEANFRLKLNLP